MTESGTEKDEQGDDHQLVRYLGNTMCGLRLKHHLTIAEIARRMEISHGMLSKLEYGQRSADLDTRSHVARPLGLSLSSPFRQYDVPVGSARLARSGEGQGSGRRRTLQYRRQADGGPVAGMGPMTMTMLLTNMVEAAARRAA